MQNSFIKKSHLLFGTLHLFLASKNKPGVTTYIQILVSQKIELQKQEKHSKISVVGHVAGSGAEFCVGFNDFVHCL